MVTLNALESELETDRLIDNVTHQHAFTLVGNGLQKMMGAYSKEDEPKLDFAFGIHMTQYHCELHKYQVIMKFQFDFSEATCDGEQLDLSDIRSQEVPIDAYAQLRKKHKNATFFLCNANDHEDKDALSQLVKEFSIPQLGSQTVQEFHGHLFFGIRVPFTKEEEEKPHFFPWEAQRCKPVIKNIRVVCERVVLYRPFDHVNVLPRYALYYLFGEGNEAFMTHLQTAQVSTSPFEPKRYGPDYDDVIELKEAPKRLEGGDYVPVIGSALLKAGIVVSVPCLPLEHTPTTDKSPCYPAPDCWQKPEPITVMYRGIGPAFEVQPRHLYLSVSVVCNSPGCNPYPLERNIWTVMPQRYWVN
ncbi:hypothetical protein QWZ13_09500 [Reinekea marina]|uniref:Uncharacterized protein n=1 Tax=Reinekea marina TaxID=1310421 RepID=A0ABV7WUW6_9GAMM|nr:hypothetical protein [Reinekea marina]MDN3649144.1 hypothetical protein [Reinekea marina]